jgi:predicted solute-binding protein
MLYVFRVLDLSPPHEAHEYLADDADEAMRQYGLDLVGVTRNDLSERVAEYTLGPAVWAVVRIREA